MLDQQPLSGLVPLLLQQRVMLSYCAKLTKVSIRRQELCYFAPFSRIMRPTAPMPHLEERLRMATRLTDVRATELIADAAGGRGVWRSDWFAFRIWGR